MERETQLASRKSPSGLSASPGVIGRECSKSALRTILRIAAVGGLGCGLITMVGTERGRFGDHQSSELHNSMGRREVEQEVRVNMVQDVSKEKKRHCDVSHHLDVFGWDENTAKNNWKVCKRYKETDLVPHKKKREEGYDPDLKKVDPEPDAEWQLEISEDLDEGWLGLHRWNDSFEYGSEEADRRVKDLGYCRIHMPSVPRTGSTWFRVLFEAITGQTTFAIWPEGGSFKEKYQAYSMDNPCGSTFKRQPLNFSTDPDLCSPVRPPEATSPILLKSHTPFLLDFSSKNLMLQSVCMVVLLVRNPIDGQDAWMRFKQTNSEVLRRYLPKWQSHIMHWMVESEDVPIYVFRYEDMLYRTGEVLRKTMEALPGGWQWSQESIDKALGMYHPVAPFEKKCGSAFDGASLAEVELVRRNYGKLLRRFGYRFTKL